MMDIIEMTRQLGVEIQKQEVYRKFIAAKEANDADKQLQDDIGQFNLIRMSLDRYLSSEEKNPEKVKELNLELRDMYSKIMASESMLNYNTAKTELDALVNQINAIITQTVNGADPLTCDISSGCSGSCDSCAGCH